MPRILVVDDNPELLALLSSSFEEAGYTVQTAQRGRSALEMAKKDRPDLAIIDVLLPDLMGFEVGEQLQRQRIPVAFMSGVHKGGKAAANATIKYGAVGYFEKPFERKSLLALVAKLLPAAPAVPAPPAQAWDVEAAPGVEGPGDAMHLTGRIALTSGETSARIEGSALELRANPAAKEVAVPTIATQTNSRPGSSPGVKKAAASYEIEIDVPIMSQSLPPLPASAPPPPPVEALEPTSPIEKGATYRGTINDNLPQLFAAFLATQETGELGLSRGQVKKIVYFERGMPVFALSNLVAERLGQFLVRAGKIDEPMLRAAVDEAQRTSQRTGDVLIQMGALTEQERLYYVGQQIKSILYSLFAWTEGQYQLTFQERARKEAIKLDLHPATLVLRGVKKLYKLERLQRILGAEDRPLPGGDPLFSLSDLELQGWEAVMVARCDGNRTVRELVALSGKPEAESLGTLVALFSMRILEKNPRPR